MKLKKIRRILAQVLVFTVLTSNIIVNADTNVSQVIEEKSEINDVLNETNTEDNTKDNTEDIIVDSEEEQVQEIINEIQESNDQEEQTSEASIEEEMFSEEINENIGEVYEVKPIDEVEIYNLEADEYLSDRIEYQLKMESINDMKLLEPKTEQEYEIATAHEDGTFTFVQPADSLEEAIDVIENTPMSVTYSMENTEQVVIAKNGQIVYSTNSMARIIKHVDGKPYGSANKNTYLYSDAALTKSTTYVNHIYVEDAPIIEDAGNSAKILVTGYEGWINKNTTAPEYDMVVVPLNQVKNPSYYYVENGELKHYISSDLTGTSGHSLTISKAPSYLKSGVKYLSYDGVYFYNGSDIQGGLDILISDYKRNSRGNAINAGNPFYSYFNYLPFRSKTSYTAEELNKFIAENTQNNSKLRGIGTALKDGEQRYGVNALLALGVAINESNWGMSTIAQEKNNLFGINAIDSNPGQAANSFNSPGDSVLEFTKNYISRGYADPADWRYNGGYLGNKKNGANIKYASDPFWGEKAAQYSYRIDKYLSGSINNLRDTNTYQIAMTTNNNKVVNSKGALLYSVTNDKNQYSGYIETPFIITSNTKKNINGTSCYEIYPERNTAIGAGGAANKYSGDYDWFDRGYIADSGIKLLNQSKNITVSQPWVAIRGGINRYETAAEISKSKFNTSDTVLLVNGYAMADGLTSSPIATLKNAPILLTETNTLNSYTQTEITRLKAKNVIIVGGEGVVTNRVEQQLKNMGITSITRLAGQNRYETSLEVAKYIDSISDVSEVMVAYGLGEADAMSIAAVAARDKSPIILTAKEGISQKSLEWLKAEQLNNAYIIGGTGVVSDDILNAINGITEQNIVNNRLGGQNRYETNALVIDRFYEETLDTVIATKGDVLADALTVGSLAGLNNYPVVLIGNDLVGEQKHVLGKRTAKRIYQAGKGVSSQGIASLKRCLEYISY